MTSSECIPTETLALMIDGKATRKERKQWLPHLDECLDCRTVLAGAASYVEEMSPATPATPWSRLLNVLHAPAFTAAAAVLLVGLLGFSFLNPMGWFGGEGPMPSLTSASATAPLLEVENTAYWRNRWIPNDRGLAFTPTLEDRQIAFRIGVYLVDLRIALHEHQGDEALAVLDLLSPLIGNSQALNTIRTSLESGNVDQALEAVGAFENESRADLPSADVSFGNWVEATRLAAVGNQPSFFENDELTSALASFRDRSATEPIAKTLADIEARLSQDLDEATLSKLQRELRQLILLN